MRFKKKISRILHHEKNKLRLDFLKFAMSEKVKLAKEQRRLYMLTKEYVIESIMKELKSDKVIGA